MLKQLVILLAVVYLPLTLCGSLRSSGRTGGSRDLAGDKKTKSRPDVSRQVGDLIKDLFGDKVSGKTWQGFNTEGGGPVTDEGKLDCEFDADCCWDNVASKKQLNWTLIEGHPDEIKLQNNFRGNGTTPSGNFMAVVAKDGLSKTQDARLSSCSIACAENDAQLSIKYWTTSGVQLSVCTRDAFLLDEERGPLDNCKDLPAHASVATVTFPPMRNEVFDIVVVAKNFVKAGSAAIIDDITVSYKPCQYLSKKTKAEEKSTEEGPKTKAEEKSAEEVPKTEAEEKSTEEVPKIEAEEKGTEEVPKAKAEEKSAEEVPKTEAEEKSIEEVAEIKAEENSTEEVPAETTHKQGNKQLRHETIKTPNNDTDDLSGEVASKKGTEELTHTTEETPKKAASASKEECEQVICDFENGDSCAYVDGSVLIGQEANDTFQVRIGRFKNPVTGIVRPGDGTYYTAAYLKHGALAKLEAAVELAEDRVIRFQHYEATAGMLMKGCCDNLDNCPFQTNLAVNAIDHNWSKSSFQCPANTKKIMFVCMNDSFNEGACGIDSIEMFGASSDPDAADNNLCHSQ